MEIISRCVTFCYVQTARDSLAWVSSDEIQLGNNYNRYIIYCLDFPHWPHSKIREFEAVVFWFGWSLAGSCKTWRIHSLVSSVARKEKSFNSRGFLRYRKDLRADEYFAVGALWCRTKVIHCKNKCFSSWVEKSRRFPLGHQKKKLEIL